MTMTNEELEKELGATREFTWKLEEKIVNLENIIEQLEGRLE